MLLSNTHAMAETRGKYGVSGKTRNFSQLDVHQHQSPVTALHHRSAPIDTYEYHAPPQGERSNEAPQRP